MTELRLKYPVAAMSELFRVSRSGFYCWLNREPSLREAEEKIQNNDKLSAQFAGCR